MGRMQESSATIASAEIRCPPGAGNVILAN
jgi:hypothetical protein